MKDNLLRIILMKHDLSRIFRDIFTSSGYKVSDSYRYDLVAKKNGDTIFIKFGTNLDYAEIESFSDQITDGTGLYVATSEIGDDLYRHAQKIGLVVWDREELALHVGRAVLADMESGTSGLELVSPAGQHRRIPDTEVGRDDENPVFGMFEQNDAPAPALVSEAAWDDERVTQRPPLQPRQLNVLNLRGMPVNIAKEHAVSVAKPHIGVIEDAVLKFVPFWRYDYSVNSKKQYKSKIVDISGEGTGCLNALNGNNESMNESMVTDEVYDQIAVPDGEYDVKNPILTQEEANKNLTRIIVDQHTRDICFDNVVGSTLISEHKTFSPNVAEIKLDIDLVYLPIWELKGSRNSIEINACNAEVLSNPVDDDVEFM